MDHFKQLETFVTVATRGSLSAIAAAEDVVLAITGRRIDALEECLGVRLLTCTTQYVILTFKGSVSLEDCQRTLNGLRNAEISVSTGGIEASGYLRVTAPAGLGCCHVASMVSGFIETRPDVSTTPNLGDRVIDLTNEGSSCAIRLDDLPGSSLVSIYLWENRRVMVVAPSHLERHGVPAQIEQLSTHNYLAFGVSTNVQRGQVFQQDSKVVTVKVSDMMERADSAVLHEWCLRGYGLAWCLWWEVGHDVATDKLVTVLDALKTPPVGIHVAFPQHKHLLLCVRLLIDLLKNTYGSPACWCRADAPVGIDQQSPRAGETPYAVYNQDKSIFPHPTSGSRMFQYILIPTDDSELSRRVAAGAFDFAKTPGARLTACTCLKEYPYTPFSEIVVETPQAFKEWAEAQAHVVLKDVEDAAINAGIRCNTDMSCFAVPYTGIVDAAERHGCDVIFMASHGRHGLAGLLLDSGAQKVLTHIEIPVIVYRRDLQHSRYVSRLAPNGFSFSIGQDGKKPCR